MSAHRQHKHCIGREYIVLIPLLKSSMMNKISIERSDTVDIKDKNIIYSESVSNVDFIIYKNIPLTKQDDKSTFQSSSEFKVFMVDKQTKKLHQENRILRFWFNNLEEYQCVYHTNEFLHQLFKSDEFPRDYLLFVKRLMELLRLIPSMRKLELEIHTLNDENNHSKHENTLYKDANAIKERLLDLLEQAFPNPMFVNDLVKYVEYDDRTIFQHLVELEDKNFVKRLDCNGQQWTRVIISAKEENTHKVILYKSISELSNALRPTVAILTVNYFEKLAVDAMIENKVTFVRHKAGESNVYTIGKIGAHHVISTKLPLIGRSRTAQISTGSTTTRLLGIFQYVQHVFIIGCAGGIPHYTDSSKHIRRGDIIVGYPNDEDYVYGIYEAEQSSEGYEFISTCFKPKNFQLYELLESIKENYEQTNLIRTSTHKYPWEKFLEEGIEYLLSNNINCLPPSNDRLCIKMEENNEQIEIEHRNIEKNDYSRPTVRFGMIAGGKNIIANDYFKLALYEKCNVLCFDTEIDQVIAAIQGNRIESFMIIRGISDYYDGTISKDWQPYSSLCAASFMKTIIYKIRNKLYSHSSSETDYTDDLL